LTWLPGAGRISARANWPAGAAGISAQAITGTMKASSTRWKPSARPLAVNSWHRCEQWNVSVGGATNSMHRTIAVDLALAGHDWFALLAAAERLGFTGIGRARMFIHLDRRAAPARWYCKRSAASWQT